MGETSGEKQVRRTLRDLGVKAIPQYHISNLRGDKKSYRIADFFLPDYGVFVEFLGTWDNPNKKKREEYRRDNNIKKRVYEKNGLKCIWIYPNHQKSLDFVLKKKLNVFKKKPKIKPYGLKEEKNCSTLLIVSIFFILIGLFFISWNSNDSASVEQPESVLEGEEHIQVAVAQSVPTDFCSDAGPGYFCDKACKSINDTFTGNSYGMGCGIEVKVFKSGTCYCNNNMISIDENYNIIEVGENNE
jgi:hypothetical protein